MLVLLALAVVAGGLVWDHLDVENARAPLPLVGDLIAPTAKDELPTSVSVIETARQAMPRSAVLDPGSDPRPQEPYVMTHPAFVVGWADGRLLLIDTGMTRDRALTFGKLIERFGGAQPIEPLTSAAAALGDAAKRVQGIVFTHLHIDHVDGLAELCPKIGHRVRVFMTGAQLERQNFTTREGIDVLRAADCVNMSQLGGGKALMPLEGFPGVGVIAAAGHTPGSELIVVHVKQPDGSVRRYLFGGDTTNTIDGVRADVPKPLLYRLVFVPEDDERLGELRRYMRALERDYAFTIVVSHDQGHLKETGIPAFAP